MVFEVAVIVGGMFVCSTILVRYGKVYYVFGLIVWSFVLFVVFWHLLCSTVSFSRVVFSFFALL